MTRLSRRHGIHVTFTGAVGTDPMVLTGPLEAAREAGGFLTAQIFPRPIGMVVGLDVSWNPFSFCPSFAELLPLAAADRAERMRDPALRARLLAEEPDLLKFPLARQARNFARMYPIEEGFDYEPTPDQSIVARAAYHGTTPIEETYDWLLRDAGRQTLLVAMGNFADGTLGPLGELLGHEATVVGLGDGGAHYGMIADASYPTTLLAHWVRDRAGKRLSIEAAVHELTSRPAELVGLLDRGLVRVGYRADLNVIDLAGLKLHRPEPVADLPAGGRRLSQRADGYRAAIVAGRITYRNGHATGALPGRLVRGRKPSPVAACIHDIKDS